MKLPFIRLITPCKHFNFFDSEASPAFKEMVDKCAPGGEGLGKAAPGVQYTPEFFQNHEMYIEGWQCSTDALGHLDLDNTTAGKEMAKKCLKQLEPFGAIRAYAGEDIKEKKMAFYESIVSPDSPRELLDEMRQELFKGVKVDKSGAGKPSTTIDFAAQKEAITKAKAKVEKQTKL